MANPTYPVLLEYISENINAGFNNKIDFPDGYFVIQNFDVFKGKRIKLTMEVLPPELTEITRHEMIEHLKGNIRCDTSTMIERVKKYGVK